MKKSVFMMALLISLLSFYQQDARAQGGEPEKSKATRFEVGAQFSSITFEPEHTQPGLGGRFTYNFNDNIALEAELNYFPNDNGIISSNRNNGRVTEGLFGVKAGKRFKNFGIFGKARPGFLSFSRGFGDVVITGPPPAGSVFPQSDFVPRRLTHTALDLGGVLEFYPSRRWVTRFDIGETLYRVRQTTFQSFAAGPNNTVVVAPATIPSETRYSFQFSAGIGYRF
ncbi:MAG: outer membrane beta-barrel protein [Pyrinomonadaceae bacterium]|nr:outer membrane beta-barrel protein [Pyrinomonadaceae bacterium]